MFGNISNNVLKKIHQYKAFCCKEGLENSLPEVLNIFSIDPSTFSKGEQEKIGLNKVHNILQHK